jgi:TPR repeat protein
MKYLITILLLIAPLLSMDVFDKLEQIEQHENYFEKGKQYYKERNYTKAYEYFEKAAQLGNQKALYNIGVIYSNKNYHRQDFKKAYDIFYNLAQKGHAPSQNRVGMHLIKIISKQLVGMKKPQNSTILLHNVT